MKIRLLEIVPIVNMLIFEPCANIMSQLIAGVFFFFFFLLFKLSVIMYSPKLSTKFRS